MDNTPQTPAREVIDLRVQFKKLWRRKRLFLRVWIVTFVLSCIYILPQPRTYVADLALAPEVGSATGSGLLTGIASSFGINLGDAEGADALYPELYPDVLASNDFLVDLLYTRVKPAEGDSTTYLRHIIKARKNPYARPYYWCRTKIKNLFEDDLRPISAEKRIDPRRLTRIEDMVVEKVRTSVTCDIDIKTSVITITVKDQDKQVCTQIADTVRTKLQDFITAYRTSKARVDERFYFHLLDSARLEYERLTAAYSRYCDSHKNAALQRHISERDKLENDLQTSMNAYNALQAQHQAARAKVQERTPAFTILRAASEPVKPTAPKRMIFVAAMLFMATIGTCLWIFRRELTEQFIGPTKA